MAPVTRLKQALIVIGAVTVLGLGLLVGGILYLMWDARREPEQTMYSAEDESAADPATEESSPVESDAETTTSDVSA